MNSPCRILQILDTQKNNLKIADELNSGDFDFKYVELVSEEEFLTEITSIQPDLVITDYSHPNFDGIEAIARAKIKHPDTIFIVFTKSISELDAIECIKAGVSNILNEDQSSSIMMIIQETLKFQQARLEKKQIEEQLAKERQTLSITLASIGEAIITVDRSNKIILFNQAAEKLTGFSQNDAVDHSLREVFQILDEKDNTVLVDPIIYLLDLEEKAQKNILAKHPTLLSKDQNRILIAGKISPILVDQSKLAGYVIIFDDVTQAELQAAQSMLSSKMESIGQLAAGIAHEINTPIQYVGDNLEFIKRSFESMRFIDQLQQGLIEASIRSSKKAAEIKEQRTLKQVDYFLNEVPLAVEESLDGVDRVRKIVQAIREFSHPSQKINALADVNKGILTTITISKNEWKYCADLETNLDPNLPLIWCKIDELNQVLLNLIVNAAHAIQEKQKYTDPTKGKITIQTRQEREVVLIDVSDSGCGIPPSLIDRIFDPFFTTKDVGKGTGQGLSLAHNIIVNHHRGSIRVKSSVNVGTTFTIELPIDQQKLEDSSD